MSRTRIRGQPEIKSIKSSESLVSLRFFMLTCTALCCNALQFLMKHRFTFLYGTLRFITLCNIALHDLRLFFTLFSSFRLAAASSLPERR